METLMGFIVAAWLFLKGVGTKRPWIASAVALVIVAGVGYAFFGGVKTEDVGAPSDTRPTVELIPTSAYAEDADSAAGRSGEETVVRAETSGKILSVVPVGARVFSGSTLATFENATQQAALLQAEGALEAAEAALEKTSGGPRSERIAVLEAAFESAKSTAVATLLSAYATVDSAVRDSADQMFSNPESTTPTLSLATSNNQRRTEAENQRVLLGTLLKRESSASLSLSTASNLEEELAATEDEVRQARVFIDTLLASLNEAIATQGVTEAQIVTYKSSVTGARTALTAALSSIASARATLETAAQNLEEGYTGAEATDLAGAEASVKQAQGAYDAALAAYRKTIVRAGASGTILSCSASVGDILSVGNDVCRIRTAAGVSGDTFFLPLSSVKYTPSGAFVFVVSESGILEAVPVETGLVTADSITVVGLNGSEFVVRDVRGRTAGEAVRIR